MRSLAVINQKGGVGKTTTAVNLAAGLAREGLRVGLVDLDPQSHASLHLGIDPRHTLPTTYDLLTGNVSMEQVWRPCDENLLIAPAHIDLAAAEVELASTVGREMILRDHLAEMPNEFDYLIVDCPPSLSVLTLNALTAVNDVLLPLQPHYLALHGLSKLMQTIDLVSKRLNADLRMAGVVLCLYESGTRLAAEVTADVETYFSQLRNQGPRWNQARMFESRIRRNIRLAEAPSFGQSVFSYDNSCNGADDYRSLCTELLAFYAERQFSLAS